MPKDGEQRVDWVVRVQRAGVASVRMTAQTDEESDATEQVFPVLVHGVEKLVVQSGVLRDVSGTQTATVKLTLPKERRRGSTELNVQLTPSLAAVDAGRPPLSGRLPLRLHRADHEPLPAQRGRRARRSRTWGSIWPTCRSAPAPTPPSATAEGQQAAAGQRLHLSEGHAGQHERGGAGQPHVPAPAERPVFDPGQLDEMVKQGLARIYGQQHEDGGWGWWPERHLRSLHDGLRRLRPVHRACRPATSVKNDVLERGFAVRARGPEGGATTSTGWPISPPWSTLRGPVDDATNVRSSPAGSTATGMKLTAYSQALLALSLQRIGEAEQAKVVVDNLENTPHDRPGERHRELDRRAALVVALVGRPRSRPTRRCCAPTSRSIRTNELAPMIVKWMVNNRRGEPLGLDQGDRAGGLRRSPTTCASRRSSPPDYTITVDLDGKVQRTYRVNAGERAVLRQPLHRRRRDASATASRP